MRAQLVDGELVLHGTVGADFWEDEGLTASDVRMAIVGRGGPLSVRLNSGGGDAFEGAAIHSVLAAYPDRVTVYVEGLAASAASLIAMAGAEIVMTEGAMMMIHDPSGFTMGTADDHRDQAEALDAIATEYAKLYARRAKISAANMRDLMKNELWMGGDQAVERGFADRVEKREEPAMVAAFPYQRFQAAPDRLVAMARDKGWLADGPQPKTAAKPAEKEAIMATDKKPADQNAPEVDAIVKDKPEMKAKPAPTAPEPDPRAVEAIAMAERRKVVLEVAGDRLTANEVEQVVAKSKDAADAKMAAVDMICEKRMADEPEPTRPGRATVTSDEGERRAEAMIGALRNTIFGRPLEGAAMEFRGLTPKRLAIEMAGGFKHGMSDQDLVKRGMSARGVLMAGGMHSTSDFTYLTASTMNRELRDAYNSRPGSWRRISRQRTATDFRTLYSAQAGGDFSLKPVNEHGEYKGTVLTDTGESYAVVRYGRKVLLTFEAIVNDDLSAFSRLPQDFSRGAMNLESRIAWGLINSNGNLSDGTALFATARGNLAGSGGALNYTTVGAARKAMWEQRPVGAKTKATGYGDDFISAVPDLMVLPPALEIVGLQFVATNVPATDGTTNPYKGTLEPIVSPYVGAALTGGSDTAWYLFDSSLPTIEHAFLQGYEAPNVEPIEKMDPKGVEMIAEHMFGAGVVEFRGAYKNAGA